MSEETPKPEPKPDGEATTTLDPLIIDIQGLEGFDNIDKDIQEAILKKLQPVNNTLVELADILKLQNAKLSLMEKESTDAKRQVIIDRLVAADYKADELKDTSLETLIDLEKLLSTKDGRIIIPQKEPDKNPINPTRPPTEVFIPGKGIVNFWDHIEGKPPKTDETT